jgi:uncharacterized protein YbaR (Trm112 family)/SAM-dependent methyltransferase
VRLRLLDILRCPFCGTALRLVQGLGLESTGDDVERGILACHCSAFPIVAGIPVLIADQTARAALALIQEGDGDQALQVMLGLDDATRGAFEGFLEQGADATFVQGVALFASDAEGAYLIHRVSDPTFIVGEALIRGLGGGRPGLGSTVLDVCGGAGHLTRVLCQVSTGARIVLTDSVFWKQWLAKRFIAPECEPVCCDANQSLPFARDAFSFVMCSDAFHYIWRKRSLATEMARVIESQGIIVLPHLHNALCENVAPGMPLPPQWYRDLFAELEPRLFKESDALDRVLDGAGVDLSANCADDELREEPALCLVATRRRRVYRQYHRVARRATGALRVNPLYRVSRAADRVVLALRFPSDAYEAEFAACKRYLPARVELPGGALDRRDVRGLVDHRVLLDLPEAYGAEPASFV